MLTKIKRTVCAVLACVMALSLSAFPASAQGKTEKPKSELYFIVTDDLQGYIDDLLDETEHIVHILDSYFESNMVAVQSITIGYPVQIHNSSSVFFPVMDESGLFATIIGSTYRDDKYFKFVGGDSGLKMNPLANGGEYMLVSDGLNNTYIVEDGECSLFELGPSNSVELAKIDNAKSELILGVYNDAINPTTTSQDGASITPEVRMYNVMEPLVTSDFDTITITDAPEAEVFSGTFSQAYAATSRILTNFSAFAQAEEGSLNPNTVMCGAACSTCLLVGNGVGNYNRLSRVKTVYTDYRFNIDSNGPLYGESFDGGRFVELLEWYGGYCTPMPGSWNVASYDDILYEIDDGRAMWQDLSDADGDGYSHAVVIRGYEYTSSYQDIQIMDSALYSGTGGFKWVLDVTDDGDFDHNYMYPIGYIYEIEY